MSDVSAPVAVPLFVYGTLRRGHSAHHLLDGGTFLGVATTASGHTLVDAGGYPAMVVNHDPGSRVDGEIYLVPAAALAAIDAYEGLCEGLYVRIAIAVHTKSAPDAVAQAYIWNLPWENLPHVGRLWTKDRES